MTVERSYEGDVDDGDLPHGYGVMDYTVAGKAGARYRGNWRHGKKDGMGIQVSHGTGVTFVGIWSNGRPDVGEFRFLDGTRRTGRWKGGEIPILD